MKKSFYQILTHIEKEIADIKKELATLKNKKELDMNIFKKLEARVDSLEKQLQQLNRQIL